MAARSVSPKPALDALISTHMYDSIRQSFRCLSIAESVVLWKVWVANRKTLWSKGLAP
jgi:hypothetical protein